jgi:hypothetical protein
MAVTKNSAAKAKKLDASNPRPKPTTPHAQQPVSSARSTKSQAQPSKHQVVISAPKELGGLSPKNAAYRAKLKADAIADNKRKAKLVPKKKQGERGRSKSTLFKLEQRAVERPQIKILEAYESNDDEALKRLNSSVPVVLDPPRTSVFKTVELTTEICFAIANGANPSRMCADNMRMPSYTTLYAWLTIDPAFKAMWDTAIVLRAERLVDEILEIADDNSNDIDYTDEHGVPHVNGENIQRAKLRVDTRKWLASKLLPKKYGDKTILSGDDENPLQLQVTAMVASSDDLLKKIRGQTVEGEVVGK